jgi:large subunit ribosomal protein L9
LAASLNGVSISIATKASESGKVFGSVTSVQIADTLAEKGFTVDRRLIALKEPLKELGAHKVVIKLHKEVSAEVEVVVVAE